MNKIRILAVNPGSTSIKAAVYEDDECVKTFNVPFDASKTADKADDMDFQVSFRAEAVERFLEKEGFDPASFDVTVGRGGNLHGVKTGAYEVSGYLIEHMHSLSGPWHASDFGGLIALYFAEKSGCKAYIYDAPSVDELADIARITGMKDVYRSGGGHVLNTHACALKFATEKGKDLKELNVIVAHLGGGCSFMAFKNGQMIDNAPEGAFSPERAGPIPPGRMIDVITKNNLDRRQAYALMRGNAGLKVLLGTADAIEVEKRISEGDTKAKLVYDAMIYNMAKVVGGLVAEPFEGDVDAVIITGSLAYSEYIREYLYRALHKMVKEIVFYPGQEEMNALAAGALRVYKGTEKANHYNKEIEEEYFSLS